MKTEITSKMFDIHTFCDRMTCHGLKEIDVSSTKLERGFWITLFACAVCVLGVSAYVEVYEFVANPILSTISVEPRDLMRFPLIYICPMSFINWDYVMKCSNVEGVLNRSASLIPEFTSIFEAASSNWEEVAKALPPHRGIVGEEASGTIVCPEVSTPETDEQFIKRHGFDSNMIVRQCKMNGDMKDCDNMTSQVLDKEYGVCYLVDIGLLSDRNMHYQRTPGLGISLIIDIHADLVPGNPNLNYQPLVDGIKVRIGEKMDPADLTGTFVQPGTMTKLSLSAQKRKLISFPGSKTPQRCTEPQSYKLNVFNQSINYSQQLCRTDCTLDQMMNSCGCLTPMDPQFIQDRLLNFTNSYCTMDQFKSCVLPMNQLLLHQCTSKCYTACESVQVRVASSQSAFPSDGLVRRGIQSERGAGRIHRRRHHRSLQAPRRPPTGVHHVAQTTDSPSADPTTYGNLSTATTSPIPPPLSTQRYHISSTKRNQPYARSESVEIKSENAGEDDTKAGAPKKLKSIPYQPISYRGQLLITEATRMAKNIIMLDIAYDQLEYTIMVQNPSRTPASLVSSIGGQAGLWTGASIFTFIQLFVYLCRLATRKGVDRFNHTEKHLATPGKLVEWKNENCSKNIHTL